jgi:hypothetical protein
MHSTMGMQVAALTTIVEMKSNDLKLWFIVVVVVDADVDVVVFSSFQRLFFFENRQKTIAFRFLRRDKNSLYAKTTSKVTRKN